MGTLRHKNIQNLAAGNEICNYLKIDLRHRLEIVGNNTWRAAHSCWLVRDALDPLICVKSGLRALCSRD